MKKKNWNFSISLGLIAVTMLLLFSIITIQGTGAWFSNSKPVEQEIIVRLGNVEIDYELPGDFLSVDNFLPGHTETAEITILNEGTADFDYWVTFSGHTDGQFVNSPAAVLTVTSERAGQVYTGTIAGFTMNKVELLLADGSDKLEFKIEFIGGVVGVEYSDLMNELVEITVTLHAIQVEAR